MLATEISEIGVETVEDAVQWRRTVDDDDGVRRAFHLTFTSVLRAVLGTLSTTRDVGPSIPYGSESSRFRRSQRE